MQVSFQNPGLIPIEAVTTMGVNAKENENPIGFFGTGLKYAIATLLRTGQHITLFRGLERFTFSVRESEIRGKTFGFIYMNEDRLGFTTHLGAKWEQWQVFRELYSNCLDEGGLMALATLEPSEDSTTIVVSGEAFFDAALKKRQVFLDSVPLFTATDPIYNTIIAEIHPGQSNTIYYRGVKAATVKRPTVFTYNILLPQDLTEDRTLKYDFYYISAISRALRAAEDRFLEEALTNKDSLEFNMDFEGDAKFHEKVLEIAERVGPASVAPIALQRAEGWSQREARFKEAPLSQYEKLQIASAKKFLEVIGFPVTEEIFVVPSLGLGVLGMARNGKIFLAKEVIDRGGNWLAGTILEEHLHITRGFSDESREFQNFLLDLTMKFAWEAQEYLKALEGKGA